MNIEFRKRRKGNKHIVDHITILRKEAEFNIAKEVVEDLDISNSMMCKL
ncbi:hypothetical protein [Clostridium sp. UBA6640]|nr:hypothetical protein [Clostridium sp. UBA6640]